MHQTYDEKRGSYVPIQRMKSGYSFTWTPRFIQRTKDIWSVQGTLAARKGISQNKISDNYNWEINTHGIWSLLRISLGWSLMRQLVMLGGRVELKSKISKMRIKKKLSNVRGIWSWSSCIISCSEFNEANLIASVYITGGRGGHI